MKLTPPSLHAKEEANNDVTILFAAAAAAPSSSSSSVIEAEKDQLQLQDLEACCIQILARQFRDDDDVVSSTEQEEEGASSTSTSARVATNNNKTKRPATIVAVSPDRPSKLTRRWSPSSSSGAACLLPTADDPMDELFLMSLDSLRDTGRINAVHAIVRRRIFEVRRTANTGRIFFQCACCKHRPRSERAKLSTLAPQGVDSIYRAFVRFMMEHVSACRDIPWEIKKLDAKAKKVPNFGGTAVAAATSRRSGIKQYWAYSARRMGLMDGSDGKSIVFHDPREDEEEAELVSDDDAEMK